MNTRRLPPTLLLALSVGAQAEMVSHTNCWHLKSPTLPPEQVLAKLDRDRPGIETVKEAGGGLFRPWTASPSATATGGDDNYVARPWGRDINGIDKRCPPPVIRKRKTPWSERI